MRIAALVLIAGLAAAQTPSFDVASVKVSQLGKANDKFASAESIDPAPNGLNMTNASLLSCIQWAYGVKEYQISGPGWLRFERYDIAAKAAGTVSGEDLRRMLQTLLKDRFKLALHREDRELPVYVLAVGKGGERLEHAKGEGKPGFKLSEGSLVFQHYSLADWAEWASVGHAFGLDRPIVDKTGLTGRYDFSMRLADSALDLKLSLRKGEQDPSFYNDALRELGLRLEPQKGPVQVLVIDHAEKLPVEN